MKAIYKVTNKLTLEIEADNVKSIMEELYQADNVFGNDICGKCGSTDLKHIVQEDGEGQKYYKLECKKCHHQLRLGAHKKNGTLFPRFTRPKTKEVIPNNGWEKWSKDDE